MKRLENPPPVAKKSYGAETGPAPVSMLKAVRLTCMADSASYIV